MSRTWSKQFVVTVSVEPDDPAVVGRTGAYRSLDGLGRFHRLCRRYGVRPTYLLTYSAAGEARCRDLARSCTAAFQAAAPVCSAGFSPSLSPSPSTGRAGAGVISEPPLNPPMDGGKEIRPEGRTTNAEAEFGAHLHPEEVPPVAPGEEGNHTLRPSEVEPERLRAKLAALAERVAEAAGRRPTSYRAGFFDLTPAQVAALVELGFEADSSLGPLEKTRAGYSFLGMPFGPFFLDSGHLGRQARTMPNAECRMPNRCPMPNAQCPMKSEEPSASDAAGGQQSKIENQKSKMLVEVPMTSVFRRPFPRALFRAYFALPGPVRGALRALGLAEVLRLRPAGATAEELLAACRRTERLGEPAVMSIHSNELAAGTSTTVRTAADCDAYFERVERVFAATREQGWMSLTLSEVAQKLRAAEPEREVGSGFQVAGSRPS